MIKLIVLLISNFLHCWTLKINSDQKLSNQLIIEKSKYVNANYYCVENDRLSIFINFKSKLEKNQFMAPVCQKKKYNSKQIIHNIFVF